MNLTRLFSPITIKNMELKNRIVMPALHHLYTPDGSATPRFNEYDWRRAEGGVGLIVVGGCRYDDYGGGRAMMSLQHDMFIPGYKEFTDGVHQRGAKAGVQLYHAGRYAKQANIPGNRQAIAPSEVFSRYTRETPRAMTVDEIHEIVRNCAAAAERALAAGFDMVEIVGSAGYLVTQFLSPVTNLREDDYGGSWENRTRFARELVAAVRGAVGVGHPLGMRIAGNDFMAGSNTNEEAVAFCRLMEKVGVDVLNVTGGWHETIVPQTSGDLPRGSYAYLAAAVKDAVSVPVAASNRINDPVLAETILALGEADLISTGRPCIADPDWPKKAEAGDFSEIRRCMACNQGCLAKTFFGQPIECLVNGKAGLEYLEKEVQPATPMRLLVIGAGPGGCEFAIEAARQGHRVTLWEKNPAIGGQLGLVAAPPGKGEFTSLIAYYAAMLKKYKVGVVLNKQATEEESAAFPCDAIITATGMFPNRLTLPGDGSVPVCTAYKVLEKKVVAGRNVVIIGGGAVGCEAAQYLAREASLSPDQVYFLLEHRAEKVEKVLEMMNASRRNIAIVDIIKIGSGFAPGTAWPVFKDLKRLGVDQYSFAKVTDIRAGSVTIATEEKSTAFPCDTIVMAVGARPRSQLYETLKQRGLNVHNLGDSEKIGTVLDAVRSANTLATCLSIQ